MRSIQKILVFLVISFLVVGCGSDPARYSSGGSTPLGAFMEDAERISQRVKSKGLLTGSGGSHTEVSAAALADEKAHINAYIFFNLSAWHRDYFRAPEYGSYKHGTGRWSNHR